jgi:hypothetical protein
MLIIKPWGNKNLNTRQISHFLAPIQPEYDTISVFELHPKDLFVGQSPLTPDVFAFY